MNMHKIPIYLQRYCAIIYIKYYKFIQILFVNLIIYVYVLYFEYQNPPIFSRLYKTLFRT